MADNEEAGVFSGGNYLQTLSRGLRLLELIGELETPPTAADIAQLASLPRAATYRLLATLRAHKMVAADAEGRYFLGYGVVTLARKVDMDFRSRVRALLAQLAADLDSTMSVGIEELGDLVSVATAEPDRPGAQVRWMEGMRHPMGQGAPSIAILSARRPNPSDLPSVLQARAQGHALSEGEILDGIRATAVPILAPDGSCHASLAALQPIAAPRLDDAQLARLRAAARNVGALLNASPQHQHTPQER